MSATGTSFFSAHSQDGQGDRWIAVAVGNSRCLWGQMQGDRLLYWQRCSVGDRPEWASETTECWLAAVGRDAAIDRVLQALAIDRGGQRGRQIRRMTLEEVPLARTYPTLGIDRALVLVGAAQLTGWPVLVVDGGTALTFSAADDEGCWFGGAILPGLGLQAKVVHEYTAALPCVDIALGSFQQNTGIADNMEPVYRWPSRWASETAAAIQSGIICSAIATVRDFSGDWRRRYPDSPIVFAGGDGELLWRASGLARSSFEPALVLLGMAASRSSQQ